MPAPFERLERGLQNRVLVELYAARDRVLRLLRTGKSLAGADATEYDRFVAAEARTALDVEIARLERALLGKVLDVASLSASHAAADMHRDLAPLGFRPIVVDRNVIAFAADVAAEEMRGVTAQVRLGVRRSVVQALAGGLSRNDLVAAVADAVGGERTAAGVERIVRTEVSTAYVQTSVAGDQQLLEQGADLIKVWRNPEDDRSRPDHAAVDGQERELDEMFSVGGGATAATAPGEGSPLTEECNAPLDPALSPGQRIQCRCWRELRPRTKAVQPYTKSARGASQATSPRAS